jgi:hypothetical protein
VPCSGVRFARDALIIATDQVIASLSKTLVLNQLAYWRISFVGCVASLRVARNFSEAPYGGAATVGGATAQLLRHFAPSNLTLVPHNLARLFSNRPPFAIMYKRLTLAKMSPPILDTES